MKRRSTLALAVSLLLCASIAGAQTVPASGIWIDQSYPARYCVVERAQFGTFGDQVYVACAFGYGNAGSNVVRPAQVAAVPLYRLQSDGAVLTPQLLYVVHTVSLAGSTWRVNFGDTPAPATLTRAGPPTQKPIGR